MTDTPRTDAQPWINQYPNYHASATRYVSADFARQLERENAALRQQLEDVQRVRDSIEGALVDAYDEAEACSVNKARLADTAEEVLKAYINVLAVETDHPCPQDLVICRQLRAAIDAQADQFRRMVPNPFRFKEAKP